MNFPNIAIIGAGNMGSSLIGGLIKKHHPPQKLWVSDSDEDKLVHLNQLGIHTSTQNLSILQESTVVILAIKPQLFAKVIPTLADSLRKHSPLIISIAAGITIQQLERWLGFKAPIIRTMPNIPALINCGASALFANEEVTENERDLAESILECVGTTVWLSEEKLMDTVTALSGSGPAYFFLMMEAMQQAGEELGLPKETARLLTLQQHWGLQKWRKKANNL